MHPNLLKLLVANKGRGFFKAEKSAQSDEATVYVYDIISNDDWWGGITPLAFMKELAGITAETIHLRINSPGGDVFAARAMQQAIREHSAHFIAHIDGLAASAATFLPMVTDESVIAPGSMFMIHQAWTIALGNATDFRKTADLLDKIDESIVNDYAGKTGQDIQQLKDWMAAETYFMDQEAVDNGFIDRMAEASPAKNQIAWDLSAYLHAPEHQNRQNPANMPDKTPLIDPLLAQTKPEPPKNRFKNRPLYREFMPA